jgi:hypothetical protein
MARQWDRPVNPIFAERDDRELLYRMKTDIEELQKLLQPAFGFGSGDTGLAGTQIPFYFPAGSGDGSSGTGASLSVVRLEEPLYRGVRVNAQLQSWNGAAWGNGGGGQILVYGDLFNGYGFDGELFAAFKSVENDRYYAVGCGTTFCKGTVASQVTSSGTASVTVRGNKQITITGYYGTLAANKKFGVNWDEYDSKWTIHAGECS